MSWDVILERRHHSVPSQVGDEDGRSSTLAACERIVRRLAYAGDRPGGGTGLGVWVRRFVAKEVDLVAGMLTVCRRPRALLAMGDLARFFLRGGVRAIWVRSAP